MLKDNKSAVSTPEQVDYVDVTTWALPEGAIARLGRGSQPKMTFSPDGQSLAIGTCIGLWIYDLATLSPVALYEAERGVVESVAFSPNGKWIAASFSDRILKILNVQESTCLTQVKSETFLEGMTFSHDNRYIAVAYWSNSVVEVWHAETGRPFARLTADIEKGGYYRPICFSPDARLIASTCSSATNNDAESIVVWNMESGEQIACLSAHTYWVTTLCFSPSGAFLVSGGEDGTVYVWDVNTWQQVREYTDYGHVYRIVPSYTPDGVLRAAIANYDETGPTTISVRDLESDEMLYIDQVWGQTATEFFSIFEWGNKVVFSNGSQLAYERRHEYVNVWTTDNPVKRQFMHSPISFPDSLVFSGDGKTLAVKHFHEGVVLWDIESKRSRPAIKEESAGKNQFVYKTNSGKLYVASIQDETVTLWEVDSDRMPLIEATGREYWSAHPALTPSGTLFAYADGEGNLHVWDVQSEKKLYELTHPLEPSDNNDDEDDGDFVDQLRFSLDGKLLASESKSNNVRLWDMELGEEVETFPSDNVTGIIEFSPCGEYLSCSGIEDLLIWEIRSRRTCKNEENLYRMKSFFLEKMLSLPEECEHVDSPVFSSCGQYIVNEASWNNKTKNFPICLWEVASGKHLATFRGHTTDIHALAFSPDNKLLASASYDGTILLWDLTPYL